MPLFLPEGLPAINTLTNEHITGIQAYTPHTPSAPNRLRIAVLNLMPMKEETETDLARMLAVCPEAIELTFMQLRSHVSRHASPQHLQQFYHYPDELTSQHFDGFIVTGAPIETIPFEAVDYWQELCSLFDWANSHVRSTLYLCWAAMAALYHFHSVPKHLLPTKRFGVFEAEATMPSEPIFTRFDKVFAMPNSRHTEVSKADILASGTVKILAESAEAGICMAAPKQGNNLYILGHFEYPVWTLGNEYHRDLGKRSDVELPRHYYPQDNAALTPIYTWQTTATLFYSNWIHFYVTPLKGNNSNNV